jgi:hypothetical protein
MINLSWFAAPILAQRSIELHSIETHFDEAAVATVYTVREISGKIGTFSIPTFTLSNAVADGDDAIKALLRPHFAEMDFSDGQPVIPKVQPDAAEPPEDSGQPDSAKETVNEKRTGSGAADSAGSSTPPAKPTRRRSRPRPAVEPTDGGGSEFTKSAVEQAGESTDRVDESVHEEDSQPN